MAAARWLLKILAKSFTQHCSLPQAGPLLRRAARLIRRIGPDPLMMPPDLEEALDAQLAGSDGAADSDDDDAAGDDEDGDELEGAYDDRDEELSGEDDIEEDELGDGGSEDDDLG